MEEKYGVFKFEVKPGNYEIVNTKFWHADAYVYRESTAKNDFSIPITLEAGKTYYLGRFLAHGIRGENIFGMPIPTSGFWVIDSNPEVDIEQISKKYPALNMADAEIVEITTDAPPYLFLKPNFDELKSLN